MEHSRSTNKFSNHRKIIQTSSKDWESAKEGLICELNVTIKSNNCLVDQYGRELQHFCTTSYLGLDYNQKILDGAIQGILKAKTLRVANSKNRCKLDMLEQYETALSTLFNSICLSTLSCSAAALDYCPYLPVERLPTTSHLRWYSTGTLTIQ